MASALALPDDWSPPRVTIWYAKRTGKWQAMMRPEKDDPLWTDPEAIKRRWMFMDAELHVVAAQAMAEWPEYRLRVEEAWML